MVNMFVFQERIIEGLTQDVERLERENAELRRDAERYRWLRHGDNDEDMVVLRQHDGDSDAYAYLLRNDRLDQAIDAAMTEEARG